MVPRMPPQEARLGFVYSAPYRIQGISVAGEQAVIHVPELDVVFDIGLCPRPTLASPTVALTHTHMDHMAGLPYWFSQRFFQKMPGTARCLVHPKMVEPLRRMMASWVDLERQRTPHEIVPIEPESEFQLRPNMFIRAIEVSHTTPALAFLLRDEFVDARVVISECTFFEDEHRDRAKTGKHIHVEDLRPLLAAWKAKDVVIAHVSRRTLMPYARERIEEVAGPERAQSVHLLMDHRTNRARHESQVAASGNSAGTKQAEHHGAPTATAEEAQEGAPESE